MIFGVFRIAHQAGLVLALGKYRGVLKDTPVDDVELLGAVLLVTAEDLGLLVNAALEELELAGVGVRVVGQAVLLQVLVEGCQVGVLLEPLVDNRAVGYVDLEMLAESSLPAADVA